MCGTNVRNRNVIMRKRINKMALRISQVAALKQKVVIKAKAHGS